MKESFVLYYELRSQTAHFTDEELGKLIRMIFAHEIDGAAEPSGDPVVDTAYKFVLPSLERNAEKYEATCVKNRENGIKSAARRAERAQATAAARPPSPSNPADPDSERDPERDPERNPERDPEREPENVSETGAEEPPAVRAKGGAAFRPPTVEEIRAYEKSAGLVDQAQRIYDYYDQQGWHLANGNTMHSWTSAVRNWHARDKRSPRHTDSPSTADSGFQPGEAELQAIRDLRRLHRSGGL